MIDIELIFQKHILDKKVKLIIEPLAPLSMVSDIPGTYFKTQNVPDKYKICGLFENILGWHFSKNDRIKIAKKIKEFNVKKLKNIEYSSKLSNSSYQPLLFDSFETGLVFKQPSFYYNDLWKKAFSRMDADVHPKGTPNVDYEVLRKKKWIKFKEQEQEKIKEKINKLKKDEEGNTQEIEHLKERLLPNSTSPLLAFFKNNANGYPMYYTSPTQREYVVHEGSIQIKIDMTSQLFFKLNKALQNNSTAYLGNSEGWVEIKIEEL